MNRQPTRRLSRLADLLPRFTRDARGAVAIWFAVLALPLAVLSFALIDVNRASVEKRHLQDALDAATLLAARSTAKTEAEIQTVGEAALLAQLSGVSDAVLSGSTFKLSGTKIVASATATVDPFISDLWLDGPMDIGAKAEVSRSSTNLELALVLDLTQSMSGTKIADLKTAAKDLLDLVISDVQSPYYSKAALVPYSYGVNLGSTYANAGRGTIVGSKPVTATAWQSGTTSNTIKGVTNANPAVVTTQNNHGYQNGDTVYITGVSGITQINGKAFVVANKGDKTFELQGVNSKNYGVYSNSSGTARKCIAAGCELALTSTAHGNLAGEEVYLTGLKNSVSINNGYYTVGSRATDWFTISGLFGPTATSKTGLSGTSQCTKYGCQIFRFTNDDGGKNAYTPNTCVTERPKSVIASFYDNIDDNDYTDTAPSTLPAGIQYTSGGSTCLSATITPLSSDKAALKNTIANYTVSGSTAGQIGVGWGWYAVSPNFGSMWTGNSTPAAYGTKDLLKVVVIMTDGAFNTPYCRGVQASNAEISDDDEQIDCKGTDGIVQAKAMCEAMKKQGIIVYTVGFALGNDEDAKGLMASCATSDKHAYLPSGGTALKDAFSAIGRDITKLRLSK
jgi:Flp pilus assembly protein TadG